MLRRGTCLCLVLVSILALAGCKSTTKKGGGPTVPGTTLPPGCGNSRLDGLEPCDGQLVRGGSTCAGYGLGTGNVSCSVDCQLSFAACATQDLCTANNWYGDGKCDDCLALGGATVDSDCTTLCAGDATCADTYNPLTGTWSCQAATGAPDPDCGTCGNGVVEGHELCDGAAFAPDTSLCTDYGFMAGELGCTDKCIPDFAGCLDHICGNYLVEHGETCDGKNLLGRSCESEGFAGGELTCTSGCTADTSGCTAATNVSYTNVVNAYCSWLGKCEATIGRMFGSTAECQTGFQFIFNCEMGSTTASQATVDACASAINGLGCDPATVDNGPGGPCDQIGSGSDPGLGERCEDSCAGDLYCRRSQTAGVCAVCASPVGTGQSCETVASGWAPCDADNFCNSTTSHCEALKTTGTACGNDGECLTDFCKTGHCADPLAVGAPCADGDHCAGAFRSCIDGFCSDPRLVGEACTGEGDCTFLNACVDGFCASVPLPTCTPGTSTPPGNIGQPCGMAGCVLGAHCNYSAASPICVADTAAGLACTDYVECGPQAYCLGYPAGICAAYSGLDGSCATGARCAPGLYCDYSNSVCKAPQQNGATCQSGLQCQSGYCPVPPGQCADPAVCTMP